MVALISGYCCRSSIINKMPSPKVTIKSHVIKQYLFIIASNFGKQIITLRNSHRILSYPTLQSFFFFLHLKNIFFPTGGQLLFSVVFLLYSKVNLVCARVHACVYVCILFFSFFPIQVTTENGGELPVLQLYTVGPRQLSILYILLVPSSCFRPLSEHVRDWGNKFQSIKN